MALKAAPAPPGQQCFIDASAKGVIASASVDVIVNGVNDASATGAKASGDEENTGSGNGVTVTVIASGYRTVNGQSSVNGEKGSSDSRVAVVMSMEPAQRQHHYQQQD